MSGPFQRDALNGIAQIHVLVGSGLSVLVEALVAGRSHASLEYHD